MLTAEFDDRLYFKSDVLEAVPGVEHFFTSKLGGLSHGDIKGLNLGFRVGDDPTLVEGNYRLICRDFGLDYEKITAAKQIHSAKIQIINENNVGFGVSDLSKTFEADGLVTNLKMCPLRFFMPIVCLSFWPTKLQVRLRRCIRAGAELCRILQVRRWS